jgi:NADPH-dependent 2,4-dienoyl-CoA reductase/sulfur reductase-like enzyme
VLVIGGGFTGSEVASVCGERDLAVALVERGRRRWWARWAG